MQFIVLTRSCLQSVLCQKSVGRHLMLRNCVCGGVWVCVCGCVRMNSYSFSVKVAYISGVWTSFPVKLGWLYLTGLKYTIDPVPLRWLLNSDLTGSPPTASQFCAVQKKAAIFLAALSQELMRQSRDKWLSEKLIRNTKNQTHRLTKSQNKLS